VPSIDVGVGIVPLQHIVLTVIRVTCHASAWRNKVGGAGSLNGDARNKDNCLMLFRPARNESTQLCLKGSACLEINTKETVHTLPTGAVVYCTNCTFVLII
jgi:hypothetical protein